jgi:WD40 repeat protein
MAFSPDGTGLVTQGVSVGHLKWAGPIRLWSLATGKEIASFLRDANGLGPVCWSRQDGSMLIPQTDANTGERILDVATGRERVDITRNHHWLTIDQGRLLLSVVGDRTNGIDPAEGAQVVGVTGEVWDVFPEGETWTLYPNSVCSMSPDGGLVVVGELPKRFRDPRSPPYEMNLTLRDVKHGRERLELETVPVLRWPGFVLRACFSPDGETVAVDSEHSKGFRPPRTRQVSLFDVATGRKRVTLVDAQTPVFVQGGRVLATFFPHPTEQWCVKLWDSTTGVEVGHIKINSPQFDCSVRKLQSPSDGKILVVSASYTSKPNWISTWAARWRWLQWVVDTCLRRKSDAPALTLFDAVSGEEIAALPPARCHWFSPDGKLFATKRTDESQIRVWDVPPRKPWSSFAVASAVVVMGMATLARWWSRRSGRLRSAARRAFPIAQDEYLLTVLRYVERNPLRAGLVRRAER